MSEKIKKMDAPSRLAALFDDGVYTELDADASGSCSAVSAYGSVGGATAFAFCQDSSSGAGAVDARQARKLARVYELAAKTGAPVALICDAGGAKIDEGFATLEAASEILKKSSELSGVVPQAAVVVGPCGGFMALAAAMSDVCVMSKDAELFLTPAFSDKANGGKTENVGSAEFAKKAGVAAIVCDDELSAIRAAADALKLFPSNNLEALPAFDFEEPAFGGSAVDSTVDAGSAVKLFDGVGESSSACLATICGTPCGVLEINGRPGADDSAKCARLVEICDAFSLPVVSFIDTEGFANDANGDMLGGIRAASRLAHVLAEATTVKISVITGKAVGSAFAAFCSKNAGADMTFAWENAAISPLSCEAMASLLWKDRINKSDDLAALGAEYAATEASAAAAAKAGLVDAVIAPADTRAKIASALDMLASKRVSRLPKKHGNLPL